MLPVMQYLKSRAYMKIDHQFAKYSLCGLFLCLDAVSRGFFFFFSQKDFTMQSDKIRPLSHCFCLLYFISIHIVEAPSPCLIFPCFLYFISILRHLGTSWM